ncbi:MAG: RsmE family RNA methyltransferase [Actinomycetota bacterium]
MTPPTGAHPDGRGGPHAFVEHLDQPVLTEDDHHHLRRVLRLRDGDPLTISDGAGAWRPAVFGDTLGTTGPTVQVAAPTDELTLAVALTKGAKPELVVQKATELGIDRIALFVAERSIPRWDADRTSKQLDRLRRVVRESSMQCRRVRMPTVEGLLDVAETRALAGASLADMGASPYAGERTVLVGPEGGWTDEERDGMPTIGLGPHVLRAETAAIAAATLMAAHHRAS